MRISGVLYCQGYSVPKNAVPNFEGNCRRVNVSDIPGFSYGKDLIKYRTTTYLLRHEFDWDNFAKFL